MFMIVAAHRECRCAPAPAANGDEPGAMSGHGTTADDEEHGADVEQQDPHDQSTRSARDGARRTRSTRRPTTVAISAPDQREDDAVTPARTAADAERREAAVRDEVAERACPPAT